MIKILLANFAGPKWQPFWTKACTSPSTKQVWLGDWSFRAGLFKFSNYRKGVDLGSWDSCIISITWLLFLFFSVFFKWVNFLAWYFYEMQPHQGKRLLNVAYKLLSFADLCFSVTVFIFSCKWVLCCWLAGKFQGSFGEILKACWRGTPVAVKRILPNLSDDRLVM